MDMETGHRVAPVPLEGDEKAVKLATFHRENGEAIPLSGCWAVIDPPFAEAALSRAVSIKPVNERVVEQMAGDMAALRWKPTGEAIVFDADGGLVKGRHRLQACIKADRPFVSLVLAGIDPGSVETSDNLRGRRLADILHIQGEPNYRSFATMLQILWRMRDGGYDRDGTLGSDEQLLGMLERMPKMRESLAFAAGKGRTMRLQLYAALHFLLHHVDDAKARDFFRAMMDDGAALAQKKADKRLREGHPARVLNDFIMHERSIGHGLDRNRMVGAAAMILAWNAFVSGEAVKTLRWKPTDSEDNPNGFPKIAGWDQKRHALAPAKMLTPVQLGSRQRALAAAATPAKASARKGAGRTKVGKAVSAMLKVAGGGAVHPLAAEVWQAAFPNGAVPAIVLRMVGPDEARTLLERNTSNRGKVEPITARYARDMEAGEFRSLNGQTVKMAETGRLLDAQHRMEAILRSGESLPFVFVEGLPETVFVAMDRTDTRTFKDVLLDRKVSNAGTIAAATKLEYLWEQSRFKKVHGVSPSNPELTAVLARNPGLEDGHWYNDDKMRQRMVPAACCWIEYRLKQADAALAAEFLAKLKSGAGLEEGDPILVLRERLTDLREERKNARAGKGGETGAAMGGTELQIYQAALTILAWNAWVKGKAITARTLAWKGVEKAGFPEVVVPEAQASLLDVVADAGTKKRRRKAAATVGRA
ncbi:hypothetical protein [Azospirillum canadense]|uniref:hypothetical protein n=1 Tax=Azospirillum canadense TaxID=403962 RepID=UPI002227E3E6|nr:hypothetical protein [Azospirillum canadense]MCW2240768.1 hypothetical protein [Azospirillum canadense]